MRLSRFIPIFCVLVFSTSCHSDTSYSGEHLTPKVMQKVLMDVNLAEAYSVLKHDSLHLHGEKNIDSLSQYYQDIFNHYKISKEQFTQSLKWYKYNPGNLDTMYAALLSTALKWQEKNPLIPVKKP